MTPRAVSNPPRKTEWGEVWTGVWGPGRVRLFYFRAPGRGAVDHEHFTHMVLLDGEADLEIDGRRVRAFPHSVVTAQPGQRHRVIPTGEGGAHLLFWYEEESTDGAGG